jgi:hypothetical protein
MSRISTTLALSTLLACSFAQAAEPEYVTIAMEIDVAKPAADAWATVGGYCDISKWANLACEITSGDGGMGTVRVLDNGRVTEILVAQTELSYGYTQPVVEGTKYNLYHGFFEARPVTTTTSKLLYTLVLDASVYADQSTREADLLRRRTSFEGRLKTMKTMVEAP